MPFILQYTTKDITHMNLHKIQKNEQGLYIETDGGLIVPFGESNFKEGDPVLLNYIEHNQVVVTDDSVETTNPYTETWQVNYIDRHLPLLEKESKKEIDTSVDTRFDREIPDLMLWAAIILTTLWMIYVTVKVLK